METRENLTMSEWLSAVLARPSIYIGHSSIEEIGAFMQGVFYASKNEPDSLYLGFAKWVREKYECDLAVGWTYVVTHETSDQDAALELARALWLEYQEAKEKLPESA